MGNKAASMIQGKGQKAVITHRTGTLQGRAQRQSCNERKTCHQRHQPALAQHDGLTVFELNQVAINLLPPCSTSDFVRFMSNACTRHHQKGGAPSPPSSDGCSHRGLFESDQFDVYSHTNKSMQIYINIIADYYRCPARQLLSCYRCPGVAVIARQNCREKIDRSAYAHKLRFEHI